MTKFISMIAALQMFLFAIVFILSAIAFDLKVFSLPWGGHSGTESHSFGLPSAYAQQQQNVSTLSGGEGNQMPMSIIVRGMGGCVKKDAFIYTAVVSENTSFSWDLILIEGALEKADCSSVDWMVIGSDSKFFKLDESTKRLTFLGHNPAAVKNKDVYMIAVGAKDSVSHKDDGVIIKLRVQSKKS